jgi:hypothetical protein
MSGLFVGACRKLRVDVGRGDTGLHGVFHPIDCSCLEPHKPVVRSLEEVSVAVRVDVAQWMG